MKPASLLVFAFLGYFGIKTFAKSGAAKNLQFFVQKVSLSFSGITPILNVMFGIQNPSSENLRIGSIVGSLYINGNYAANISGYQLTDIRGFATTYFPVSARLSLYGVVQEVKSIVDAISSGSLNALLNQQLRFKGVVNAEGFNVPLDFTYNVL